MTKKYMERILIVDDEKNLLAGLERQLRGTFNIVTAEGGLLGLQELQENGPFAVIVSDMRMPDMNGIQFLVKASEMSPDTVRMMLTGNTDLETAMHAVNEGNIFRFMTKPCRQETMEWALTDAIKQYRLVTAEKELLEKTLQGSLQVMTDLLELVNPVAFSRTYRIRTYMHQVAMNLGVSKVWQYELAGLLSQIGCIAIPADTLEKFYAGGTLSKDEEAMLREHPQLAKQLLVKIPRLEKVAAIIANQQMTLDEYNMPRHAILKNPEVIGGLSLKAVIAFDSLVSRGLSKKQVISEIKRNQNEYHPIIMKAIETLESIKVEIATKIVDMSNLNNTMVLAEEIRTIQGLLVAAVGQQVTTSMHALLKNYQVRKVIKMSEVRVYVPRAGTKQEVSVTESTPA